MTGTALGFGNSDKQWGATVSTITLDNNGQEVWAMEITDPMRDAVLYEGQTRFSRANNPGNYQTGINIDDGKQAFTEEILDPNPETRKQVETRPSRSLDAYRGQEVGLVSTHNPRYNGKATMLGWATVRDAEPIIWTDYEEFHRPENEALHHITRGSAYDMKPGETKYGYYVDSPRREAPYRVTERGNVSRDVYKPIQQGQTVIPPTSETRESKADFGEKLKRKFTGTITSEDWIVFDRTEYGNLVHNIKTGRTRMSSSPNRGFVDSGSPMGLYRYYFKTSDYRDVHVYEVSSVPEGIATERIYREEYDYANDITGDEFARRGSPATTYQGFVNPAVLGKFPIGNSDGVQIQGESRTNDGLSAEQSASDTGANHPTLGGVDQGDTVSAQVTDDPTRHSYSDEDGYHAGDIGKAESFSNMVGGSRGTGHYGTGTYFVGNEAQISDDTYGRRPHFKVNFGKYNLFKPKNYTDGHDLHEFLKGVNTYYGADVDSMAT